MSPVSRDEIRTLLDHRQGPCVSIYMPAVRAGAETQQNPIRFKNLLRDVAERLAGRGLRAPEIEALLEPARRLQGDDDFWQHQAEGLAVFLAPGFFATYRLPHAFRERTLVNERFLLRPLFPLLAGDGRFYLLALARNGVRLFSGSRHSIEEMDLGTVPRNIVEALGPDDTQPAQQFKSGVPGGAAGTAVPGYQMHGAGENDVKIEVSRFFNVLDHGVRGLLPDQKAPLVLAGVEYLLPIYRQQSEYPNLVTEGITGNPEGLSPQQLHEAAWKIVEPIFAADRERAVGRYHELAGTGRASSQLEDVLPAAHDGRVDVLFTPQGVSEWGSFDPGTREVKRNGGGPEGGAEDLLDLAAVQTFLNGGTVYAVPPDAMPDDRGPLAAIYRY